MRVLIVSDTHRKTENYLTAVERVRPDLVIHCGDAEGGEYLLTRSVECPVQIVLGNCDFFSSLPKELELKIGSRRVWVTHGHNYCVSMGNEVIKREALARGMDIVLYGHTHKPVVDRGGSVIAVNPGSLSYPRQEGHRPSYAILEAEGEDVRFTIEYI